LANGVEVLDKLLTLGRRAEGRVLVTRNEGMPVLETAIRDRDGGSVVLLLLLPLYVSGSL
jgi:hypothetical protein